MYETYLQNERELEQIYYGIHPHSNDEIIEQRHKATIARIISTNRLSIIKVMKALEKELEEKVKKIGEITEEDGMFRGLQVMSQKVDKSFNEGIQLSLDKIREFISLLEKEV